jgi:hypothetical protein
MDDMLNIDVTKKLFDDMDDARRNTLDGDQYFINSEAAADQYVIEDVDDGPPEPMFGSFLLDVDEFERTDGYDDYAHVTFDLGGETGLRGTVMGKVNCQRPQKESTFRTTKGVDIQVRFRDEILT